MQEFYELTQAAESCGLPTNYFRNQIKNGGGPTSIRPSARKILFIRSDLDRWMRSWTVDRRDHDDEQRLTR